LTTLPSSRSSSRDYLYTFSTHIPSLSPTRSMHPLPQADDADAGTRPFLEVKCTVSRPFVRLFPGSFPRRSDAGNPDPSLYSVSAVQGRSVPPLFHLFLSPRVLLNIGIRSFRLPFLRKYACPRWCAKWDAVSPPFIRNIFLRSTLGTRGPSP